MRVTIRVLAISSLALMTGQSAGAQTATPPAAIQDAAPQRPPGPPVVKETRPGGPPIVLQVSQGTMLQLPIAAMAVFVADAEVADAQLVPPEMILVTARKPGATALYAIDSAGNVLLNRVVEVQDREVTIIKGSKKEGGSLPPPGPMMLQIPLQPSAPPPR